MKRGTFLVGVWALVSVVLGGPIMAAGPYRTAQEAVRVASAQMAQARGMESMVSDLELKATIAMPESDDPALYILAGQDNGFVVVSASERMPAILGYSKGAQGKTSTTSELINNTGVAGANTIYSSAHEDFVEENMPPAMKELLEQYSKLASVLEANPSATLKDAPVISDSKEQLIKTSWSQDEPFNNLTPVYNSKGERATVGCVATAMAQIIYYHKYPVKGTGSIHYLTGTNDFDIDVTYGQPYDYDNMLQSYCYEDEQGYYRSVDYTKEQGNAIATLMLHCGAAVNMDYAADEQGGSSSYSAYVPYALSRNFGYDKGSRYYQQDSYNGDWGELVRNELRADRPVLYGAVSSTMGGHAFVVDGFDKENRFHVNWGWGYNGYYDGWFMFTDLTIDEQDITFDQWHMCVVGIQPECGGSYPAKAHNNFISTRILPMPTNSSIVTQYTFKRSDEVRMYVELENYTDEFKDYEIAMAIYQGPTLIGLMGRSKDYLDEVKGESNRYVVHMGPMEGAWFSYADKLDLPVGNYTILPVYRPRYEGQDGVWKYIPGSNGKSVCYDLEASALQYKLSPAYSSNVETKYAEPATGKTLRDGKIVISRGGHYYDLLGRGF